MTITVSEVKTHEELQRIYNHCGELTDGCHAFINAKMIEMVKCAFDNCYTITVSTYKADDSFTPNDVRFQYSEENFISATKFTFTGDNSFANTKTEVFLENLAKSEFLRLVSEAI
jgi:hypothetical protein